MRIDDTVTIKEFLDNIYKRYANFSQEKIDLTIRVHNYTLAYPIMYAIPVWIKAQKILELGIGSNAISTYIFLEALKVTGGKLISCDKAYNQESYPDFDKNIWTCKNCDDMTLDYPASEFDIVMIDTDHEKEHTKKELEKFVPCLKSGGFLYMHDTDQQQVKEAVLWFLETHTDLELFYHEFAKAKPQITIYRKL